MRLFLMVFVVITVTIAEIIPLIRKSRIKAAVLLVLGAVTLAYAYYYITHEHTASLVNLIFGIFSKNKEMLV